MLMFSQCGRTVEFLACLFCATAGVRRLTADIPLGRALAKSDEHIVISTNLLAMASAIMLDPSSAPLEVKRAFWAYGALERLAHLGYLENPPCHICPDRIDLFEEFDSYCQCLFESEAEFEDLLERICQSIAMDDEDQIEVVTQLVRDYRDNRTELVRFALTVNALR